MNSANFSLVTANISFQLNRGTFTENSSYVGLEGELTYDIDNKRVRVHDGVTPGGIGLLKNGGDTMSGLLQFALKTHAGIKLNNLTTLQRDALTPISAGMMIWNINTNRVEVVNQSLVWVSLNSTPV